MFDYICGVELEYIKANGAYHYPMGKGIQDPQFIEGIYCPVCYIKKLWFGRWQIDYYDQFADHRNYRNYMDQQNQIPNSRMILYPSGIEEIKWINKVDTNFSA